MRADVVILTVHLLQGLPVDGVVDDLEQAKAQLSSLTGGSLPSPVPAPAPVPMQQFPTVPGGNWAPPPAQASGYQYPPVRITILIYLKIISL